jgi:hypothetical protein
MNTSTYYMPAKNIFLKTLWYVYSFNELSWLTPFAMGYTKDKVSAGLFSYEEALRICKDASLNCRAEMYKPSQP